MDSSIHPSNIRGQKLFYLPFLLSLTVGSAEHIKEPKMNTYDLIFAHNPYFSFLLVVHVPQTLEKFSRNNDIIRHLMLSFICLILVLDNLCHISLLVRVHTVSFSSSLKN